MLKTAMFVSALALSAPAFAQDTQTPPANPVTTAPAQTAPATPQQGAPIAGAPTTAAQPAPVAPAEPATDVTATTAADPAQAAPQTMPATPTAPAESASTMPAPAEPATAPAETAAATPAAGAPVSGATQIAQVVGTEFPSYDKNADKSLDKTEFGAWMVALKTASDPTTKAGDPATVKWINGAFASADLDKSRMVSQDELTKYLSQGAE